MQGPQVKLCQSRTGTSASRSTTATGFTMPEPPPEPQAPDQQPAGQQPAGQPSRDQPSSGQILRLYAASDFRVRLGAQAGAEIGAAAGARPGDIYRLAPEARPQTLALPADPDGRMPMHAPRDRIAPLARHMLMTPEGERVDLIVLDSSDPDRRLLLPVTPIAARIDYTLLASFAEAEIPAGHAEPLCPGFATGTRIALADGSQRPVEALHPGDRILTRDHGAQPLRHVLHSHQRALGPLAPVVIPRGALGNTGDLLIGPGQRLFLYRRDALRIGTAPDLLIEARTLIDGLRVRPRIGGYVAYHLLILDRHEILYAEGIPTESLRMTEATPDRMPPPLAQALRDLMEGSPQLRHRPHTGTQTDAALIDRLGRGTIVRSPLPDDDTLF